MELFSLELESLLVNEEKNGEEEEEESGVADPKDEILESQPEDVEDVVDPLLVLKVLEVVTHVVWLVCK